MGDMPTLPLMNKKSTAPDTTKYNQMVAFLGMLANLSNFITRLSKGMVMAKNDRNKKKTNLPTDAAPLKLNISLGNLANDEA